MVVVLYGNRSPVQYTFKIDWSGYQQYSPWNSQYVGICAIEEEKGIDLIKIQKDIEESMKAKG